MSKEVCLGNKMEKEEVSGMTALVRFLPLMVFLAVASGLLYVFLAGIGPDWLRVIIMFVLVSAVLVIAAMGWREHWKDMH